MPDHRPELAGMRTLSLTANMEECVIESATLPAPEDVVVSLDAASASPVSVSYATADGSATAASKYYAQAGTVTFNPGQTVQMIVVPVLVDSP